MIRNCLKLIILFIALIVTPKIFATDIHECSVSTYIEINENSDVKLIQNISVYNNSDRYVINKLKFDLPYDISDLQVTIDSERVQSDIDDNSIEINLNDHFIGPNISRVIIMEYKALGLLSFNGGFTSFYLPKFDYCNNDNKYEVKLPFDVEGIKYINVPSYGINENGSVDFSYSSDLYITWGELGSLDLSPEWQLDHGYYVPIPSSKYSNFTLTNIGTGVKYYQDDNKNEYFKMDNGLNYVGGYEGVLSPKDVELVYEGPLGFNEDISSFELTEDASIKEIYDKLIEKYDPILRRSVSSISSLSDLTSKTEQDPLEYAYTFANLLESKGYKANIYYGLMSLPISDELLWHFWVGASEDQMYLYDPFIEDMLGFSSFKKVTPNRYIWGSLSSFNSFVPEAIHNIKNPSDLARYSEDTDEDVLGESFLVDVFLNKPKDLSRKIELIIKNEGSNVIYLSQILLNNGIDITGDYADIGVLPDTSKIIILDEQISLSELLSNNGLVKVDVEVISSNNSVSIKTNSVQVYFHIVAIVFLIAIYLFFAGIILLIRHNFRDILLHLNRPN